MAPQLPQWNPNTHTYEFEGLKITSAALGENASEEEIANVFSFDKTDGHLHIKNAGTTTITSGEAEQNIYYLDEGTNVSDKADEWVKKGGDIVLVKNNKGGYDKKEYDDNGELEASSDDGEDDSKLLKPTTSKVKVDPWIPGGSNKGKNNSVWNMITNNYQGISPTQMNKAMLLFQRANGRKNVQSSLGGENVGKEQILPTFETDANGNIIGGHYTDENGQRYAYDKMSGTYTAA